MSAGEEQQAAAAAEETQESLLDNILEQGMRVKDEEGKEQAKGLLEEYVRQLTKPNAAVGKDVEKTINMWIAEIDRLSSEEDINLWATSSEEV